MNTLSFIKKITLMISFMALFCCQNQQFPSMNNNNLDESMNYERVTWLGKVREIKDGFYEGKDNYFVKISSVCVDKEDNLYVADSGFHRVLKFDNKGKFVCSIGSQGQGPGEFLGTIRASIGNDEMLYITDDKNRRLYKYSKKGKFIRQFPLKKIVVDVPLVNSKGDIFLLSGGGLKIIDHFNSRMKYDKSLLNMDLYLKFSFQEPPKKILRLLTMRPSLSGVKKLLTKDDHIFVVLNNSQYVIHLDQNYNLVKKFKIEHPKFVEDYKSRLMKITSSVGWIDCFGSVFFDQNENLCLSYYNASLELPEVYRYRKDGNFRDILRVEPSIMKANRMIIVCDNRGNFYSISHNSSEIIVYNMNN